VQATIPWLPYAIHEECTWRKGLEMLARRITATTLDPVRYRINRQLLRSGDQVAVLVLEADAAAGRHQWTYAFGACVAYGFLPERPDSADDGPGGQISAQECV
jgi:hypothetical protein